MQVKVCGITQLKQLQQLDGLDIEVAGLIFYPESPRYMKDLIDPKALRDADLDIKKTGVFVNPGYEEVMKAIDEYMLDAVQLHGDESPAFCKKLADKTELIKAFRMGPATEKSVDEVVAPYDEVCDYYLFDTGGPRESLGGTGKSFDWDIVRNARIEKPFFLSGGISPEDVTKIKSFQHPDFFAIDINSKFEITPGVKDMAKVLGFIKALK